MPQFTIAYIAAGAGGMYCGNCLHDNTLAASLIRQGQEVLLVPTYTPIKTDEINVSLDRVFFGGVNVYLDQKYAWYRKLPRWMTRWLNRPWLLRAVTSYGLSMRAEDLGALAVSMLKGEQGFQRREIDELVGWLETEVKPDVVHLSNVMLIGMARTMRERLGVPILSTLSGEDLFLQQLSEPYTSEALAVLRERANDVDGFVALNEFYADRMSEVLAADRSKFHVVPHGLLLDGHGTRQKPDGHEQFVIGYLGRISPEKGVDLLAESFVRLARDCETPHVRLRIAGYLAPQDQKYLKKVETILADAGLRDRYEYVGSLDRAAKIDFLQSLDCLAMPCVFPESKGLPVIEALANAVPVVVPDSGAFPEAIRQTGGGLLCKPNDVNSLTEQLRRLATDENLADELRFTGQRNVREHYSDELMARRTLALYERVLAECLAADPSDASVRAAEHKLEEFEASLGANVSRGEEGSR